MDPLLLEYFKEFLEIATKELLEKFPNEEERLRKAQEEILEIAKNKDLKDFNQIVEVVTQYYEKLREFLPEEELNPVLTQISQKISKEI